MAAFNPLVPTGLDQLLIPYEVRRKYFEEVLLATELRPFMGDSPMDTIQVSYKQMGSGATLAIPFGREIDYKNPIRGNFAQIEGREQNIKFYEDTVTVSFQAFADKLEGMQFMALDTPIDIFDAMKPKLQNAHIRSLVFQILQSGTVGQYPVIAASGPVASRVKYGSQAHQANIQAGVDSMTAGTAYNQDGLSVAKIRQLRDMAVIGGTTFETEKRISPTMLTYREGQAIPTYIYLMDTRSYVALCNDPAWSGYFTRGTIESTINQPSGLSGAFYKGMIDNVMIYECPELGNFQQTSTNLAVTASWNLFCGAQAFYLLWGAEPWFAVQKTNYQTTVGMAMMEIRGQKSLMFPSFANEAVPIENGIIHHFVSI